MKLVQFGKKLLPYGPKFLERAIFVLGTLFVTYFSQNMIISGQRAAAVKEGGVEAVGCLMASKHSTTQLYQSFADNQVDYFFYRALCTVRKLPPNHISCQEMIRAAHKFQDWVLELVRNNERRSECLARALAYFPDTEELRKLSGAVYNFGSLSVIPPPESLRKPDDLYVWKQTASETMKSAIDKEYGGPIDALVNYLKRQPEYRAEPKWYWPMFWL